MMNFSMSLLTYVILIPLSTSNDVSSTISVTCISAILYYVKTAILLLFYSSMLLLLSLLLLCYFCYLPLNLYLPLISISPLIFYLSQLWLTWSLRLLVSVTPLVLLSLKLEHNIMCTSISYDCYT
jgi:hypothetical protein